MNKRSFLNGVSNGKKDIIQELLDLLNQEKIEYCVIGGLAVNAYVDPVVSLDLDIVVGVSAIDRLIKFASEKFTVDKFEHSINLNSRDSDIRIQIRTDKRYQSYNERASIKDVLGYQMNVASLEDVLTGKVWAYSDAQRIVSKRQKDLTDILRIIESFPELKSKLPEQIQETINKIA